MRRAAFLVLLCGCSAPLRLYEGPARPFARIEPHHVVIHSVDGEEIDFDAAVRLRPLAVRPGEHVVRVEWDLKPGKSARLPIQSRTPRDTRGPERIGIVARAQRNFAEIRFDAEPGHTYRGVWLAQGNERVPAIEDVTSR